MSIDSRLAEALAGARESVGQWFGELHLCVPYPKWRQFAACAQRVHGAAPDRVKTAGNGSKTRLHGKGAVWAVCMRAFL